MSTTREPAAAGGERIEETGDGPRTRPAASSAPILIEPRRSGIRAAPREFWRHRRLIPFFGFAIVRKRVARTLLGVIWLPLRPAASLGIRTFVFGGLIGISTGRVAYAVFFLVASAAWELFFESARWATRSVELNRKLLPRVYVPKLVIIASASIPALLEFAIIACFALLAVLYYVVRAGIFYLEIGLNTLLVPAGLALLLLMGLGVGLLLSGVGARARDVRFSVGYGLSFLYFLTPVIYPLSTIPERWRGLAGLNPLTGAVEMVKAGVFADHPLSWKAVAVTLFWVALIWGPGLWLFDRREVAVLNGRPLRLPFRKRRDP